MIDTIDTTILDIETGEFENVSKEFRKSLWKAICGDYIKTFEKEFML